MSKIPFAKEAIKSLFKSPVTEKYPKVPANVPKDYRGKLVFHTEKCIGCGLCVRVCSPQSIVQTVKNVEGGKEITLSFDMSSCTFCGLCSDFCRSKAVELTEDFSIVLLDDEECKVGGTIFRKAPPKKTPPAKPKENNSTNKKD